jgi:hypothetical protein
MNIYINLDYLTMIYFVSMIGLFLGCLYAIVSDYYRGFYVTGSDIFVSLVISIVPVANTIVLIGLLWAIFVESLHIQFKRKL